MSDKEDGGKIANGFAVTLLIALVCVLTFFLFQLFSSSEEKEMREMNNEWKKPSPVDTIKHKIVEPDRVKTLGNRNSE